MNNLKRAIILVSGGLDSCVTASIAINQGYTPAFLHVNYGQLTQEKELQAFNNIADHYNVQDRLVVDIEHLKKIGGTSLIDKTMKVEEGEPSSDGIVPSTYVPFRNANMISMAVSWAEVIKAEAIFIGAVEEDSSGYPDCRAIFFEKFNDLLAVALAGHKVELKTPLINLDKSEIVKKGLELNAPLHLTWSCYQAEDMACGVCESCFLRLRGFKNANATDPIKYAK